METPATSPQEQPKAPKGFDAAADAAKLDETPLQDYTSEFTRGKSAQPGATDQPSGASSTDPKPADPASSTAPASEPETVSADAKRVAREYIEGYDFGQSFGFSWYSDGMKQDEFKLPKLPKESAIHHLAKGLEKAGTPEMPWWAGLMLALSLPAFANWQIAREHRRGKAEALAAAQPNKALPPRPAQVIRPGDAAGTAHRSSVTSGDTAQPAAPGSVTAPAPAFTALGGQQPTGSCLVCGKPAKKGRKYCSQSCSGKASKKSTSTPAQ